MFNYKRTIFLLCIASIFIFGKVSANTDEFPLSGKTIYVDAGHGGPDPGAISGKLYEKDLNLAISLKLKEVLESKGAKVLMTRETDKDLASKGASERKRVDLGNRAYLINKSKCDLFLSIHLNAYSGGGKGFQVYYDSKRNKENAKIADFITKAVRKQTSNVRKPKIDNKFYMYSRVYRPGVLIEAGFITNANDRYNLKRDEYQLKIANMITNGVIDYFNSKEVIE